MKPSQLEILPNIEKRSNEKKSRWLTILFLGLTIVPSFIFWFFSGLREKKINLTNPINSFNFSQIKLPEIDSGDRSIKLSRWAATRLSQISGKWAIKVEFLEEDFSWAVNKSDQFVAASLIKLPIIAAFYYQVEKGGLTLDEVYVLKDKDKASGVGSLSSYQAGAEFTLGELAALALSQSDNTAAAVLQKKVGEAEINRLILDWGMTGTSLEENLTTAEEITLFFKKLYQNQILSSESSRKMLDDLTDTVFEDWIPEGVPEGIRVAHKVGVEIRAISDAGIVFTPGEPFVLTILSQEVNTKTASEIFPGLVSDIYWILIGD
ncbi:MAG: serine hydrolase [Patescibacteria group bacterium]|nr:class A beta-lactamase-related serine hydrolase [Patescibacteria group bacterium]